MSLLFTSAAYIQKSFRLDFIMEANTMIPKQSAASLIWVHIVCIISYLSTQAEQREDDKSHDWQEKG